MEHEIFGTDGIRGVANRFPMTPEMALRVGKALVLSIDKTSGRKRILIGKDTRISGYIFETALTSGICSMGGDVLLTGPLPTPAVAHLTKSLAADAGIMISASHNPAEDNGIKFFHGDGYKFSEKLEQNIAKHLAGELEGVESKLIGKAYRVHSPHFRYVEYAKQAVSNISLAGFKIVLDCANGSAYQVGPQVFRELGAEVLTINNTPDGLNINRAAGVFHPEIVVKKVLETKSDLGVILDGDADRLGIIDKFGNILDGNSILSILAINGKKSGTLRQDGVAATIMFNLGFRKLMKKHKIKIFETAVGDKYVSEAIQKNGLCLGGEPSGHIIYSDFGTSADGIVATLKLIEIMSKTSKSLAELNEYVAYPQVLLNFPVNSKIPLTSLAKTQKIINDFENQLGVDGRVLVRYSGTQKIARVMVEGKDKKLVSAAAKKIAKTLKNEINEKN